MICAGTQSRGEEKVAVPKGVKYKTASHDLNEEAKKKIQNVFSESPAAESERALFGKHLICGPMLWNKVKADSRLVLITNGVMTIEMPIVRKGKLIKTQTAEGKLLQGEDEVRTFWSVLKSKYRFNDPKIRKPTALELQIFWAMIPFKTIEEPVFVVETQRAKLFLNLYKSKLTLFWIDDYQDVSFRQD